VVILANYLWRFSAASAKSSKPWQDPSALGSVLWTECFPFSSRQNKNPRPAEGLWVVAPGGRDCVWPKGYGFRRLWQRKIPNGKPGESTVHRPGFPFSKNPGSWAWPVNASWLETGGKAGTSYADVQYLPGLPTIPRATTSTKDVFPPSPPSTHLHEPIRGKVFLRNRGGPGTRLWAESGTALQALGASM